MIPGFVIEHRALLVVGQDLTGGPCCFRNYSERKDFSLELL